MITFVLIGIAVVVGIIVLVAASANTSSRLSHGLQTMGNLVGRTEADFVAALGIAPTTISQMAFGQRLLQWQDGGQHLAILFGPTTDSYG